MLIPVLGTAGSGLGEEILERLRQDVMDGGRAILLVPEQFSFESEKTLYSLVGPSRMTRVKVLSFTRLCNLIFTTFGGIAGEYVGASAQYMLMNMALEEVRPLLRVYARQAGSPGFVSSALEAVKEFKNAGASPETLREVAASLGEASLGAKLAELGLIFAAYQAFLDKSFKDQGDDLARACGKLDENAGFFAEFSVYINGFTAFMAAEYEMLRRMIHGARKVTAALCTDSLSDASGPFAAVKETAQRLIRLARESGVEVAAPVRLAENRRYRNPALLYLERYFMRPEKDAYDGGHTGVKVVEAANSYEEIEYVAAEINHLVKRCGYRYRDIAVIGRSLEGYLPVIEDTFVRYDISYFADSRVLAAPLPVNRLVCAALAAVRGPLSTEKLMALAKNPACAFSVTEAALLENYCFIWGISGALWEAPFRNNPRGMSEELTRQDSETLAAINDSRRRLVEPVLRLREALRGSTAREFAEAVYRYLCDISACDNLRTYSMESGETAVTDLNDAAWEQLMGLLDAFYTVLGPLRLPLGRYIEILELCIDGMDMGAIPQTLDQAIVGMADRIRPGNPRATFVIGATEAIFPQTGPGGGVFTDAERDRLIESGLELSPALWGRQQRENYYAYFALTTPSERLYVSYPASELGGGTLSPSVIVSEVEALFPGVTMRAEAMDKSRYIANADTAYGLLCRSLRNPSPFSALLKLYFRQEEPQRLIALERAGDRAAFAIVDAKNASALFGENMRLSPSRVERYHACPFAYFLQSGLSVRPRRRVEFSPLETGSVLHHVLEVFVSRYGSTLSGVSDDTLKKEIREALDEYLTQRVEMQETLPARFKYLYTRLVNTVFRLLRQLAAEFAQSEFVPYATEMPIAKDGAVEPVELCNLAGGRVYVEGIVDRVDIMEKGGKKYVRVVDYKSGGKSFKLAEVCYGLNLQMLIYLFSIWQNGRGEMEGAVPAGVLYMPAKSGIVSAERDTPDAEIEAEHARAYRMNGLLIEDREALSGMEADLQGVFIPARMKKDGSLDAASSLATLEQMGLLKRHIEKLITDMADSLHQGEIPARPAVGPDYNACEWCEYRAVCLHEEDGDCRRLSPLKTDEVYEILDKEAEEALCR